MNTWTTAIQSGTGCAARGVLRMRDITSLVLRACDRYIRLEAHAYWRYLFRIRRKLQCSEGLDLWTELGALCTTIGEKEATRDPDQPIMHLQQEGNARPVEKNYSGHGEEAEKMRNFAPQEIVENEYRIRLYI